MRVCVDLYTYTVSHTYTYTHTHAKANLYESLCPLEEHSLYQTNVL